MGHHLHKYLHKQHQQKVNSKENKQHYQNGANWKHDRSDGQRKDHRTID